ncbi:hypothetical protein CEE37_03060 [candidate division LCP-89 bacterium B3_LCP]|uniref:Polysaccharide pyruvyl transferase domain-containing protein n=1 Tax=candidate division LCP-89 bacterium B3_LCP TaxID=2012998 RepID=A0A532V334_UNCL8|nr:MAG: hypothetical protein CEE37_03060 [candidate division LCP-89 bacterium B3_LCP]
MLSVRCRMKSLSELKILIDRIPFAEGNLGEEAILASLLQDLKECGVTDVSVISNMPDRTRSRHGSSIKVITDKPGNWAAFPAQVKRADILIWGGGHMLQDRSSQLYIPCVVRNLMLAKIMRIPRFIYAPGMGPVVNHLGRSLSAAAIKGSREIVIRDDSSAGFLNSIGIQRFHKTADPVFSLKTDADDLPPPDNDHPVVGFAPRRLFYRKGSIIPVKWQLGSSADQNPEFERFVRETASACDQLIEKRKTEIILLPMDLGPNPRDDLICKQIFQNVKNKENVSIIDNDPPLNDFIKILGSLDLLVSARLHGIIMSLRFGLPFIGIDSDGKIAQMAGMVDCHGRVIKDKQFSAENFCDLALQTLGQGSSLRQELRNKGKILRDRARDNRLILNRCLGEIARN